MRGKINVSIGTAAVLGLADVRMDAAPTTAYLMLGGRCRMACAFCAQARTSHASALNPSINSGQRLSRITWPPFDEGEVLCRLDEAAARGDFRRVCLQVTVGQGYFRRTLELVEAVRGVCDLPVDAAILPRNVNQVEALLSAGVEHIGFGLDAACERVFREVKRARPERSRRSDWGRSIKLIEEAACRFPGRVAVHLIIGLGETEREMVEMIQRMHDLGVVVGLFAFTPVRGTAMQDQPPPPLDTYRRMQVVRHLITHDLATVGDFAFSAEGRLVSFGLPDLEETLADGVAFQTSGCPDCNRPFYNERPGGPLYNYPRPLTPAEALRAVAELAVVGNSGRFEGQDGT